MILDGSLTHSKAIVRPPAENFSDGITEAGLGLPVYKLALKQHDDYCRALQDCGLELIKLAPDTRYPDSCFVEDTAIIVGDHAIISRLGHPSRRGEESEIAEVLSSFKTLVHIEAPGTIDGGDVMCVGDHFFIGLTGRTNEAGAAQLADVVQQCGFTWSTVPIDKFIHLKTAFSAIDIDTVLCLSGVPDECFSLVQHRVSVPQDEHWAANSLSTNGFVLVPANCPRTMQLIEQSGKDAISIDTSEFQKMDGRLTCLSILL
jgi:dimethylargininase